MTPMLKLLPILAAFAAVPALAAKPDPHAGHHPVGAPPAPASTPAAQPTAGGMQGYPMISGHAAPGAQGQGIQGQGMQGQPPQSPAPQGQAPAQGQGMVGGKDLATADHSMPGMSAAAVAPSPTRPPSCRPDQRWSADMGMCIAAGADGPPALMFHLNQFMAYSRTSGPRGASRLTGPGMWMLMYEVALAPDNHLSIDVMGSPDQLTVGGKGTPQLLQTENIDAMHPHDTVMGLEFRDVITVGGDRRWTILFAPRGEAAIGPVPFMHRDSAEGNPDAPLGHTLQDGFHDVSTVVGLQYQFARTTLEITAFSGAEISWPLPLHKPDSYSLRANQALNGHVVVGASYADARLPDGTGGADHMQFVSSWLTASFGAPGGMIKSSLVWGEAHTSQSAALNSLLAEANYQAGPNAVFGRAEMLQVTPGQLGLTMSAPMDLRWVEALTAGYERTLWSRKGFSLRVGGSYTRDFVPAEFQVAYGTVPSGVKAFVHIKYESEFGHGF